MTRIGNTPGGSGPVDPTPPEGLDKIAGSQGAEGASATSGAESTAAAGVGGVETPSTESARLLQAALRDGIQAGGSPEEVLQTAVQQVAERVFGPAATPEMVGSIAEAMRRDPNLAQLVDALMRRSGGA